MKFIKLSVLLVYTFFISNEAFALNSLQEAEMVKSHNAYRTDVEVSTTLIWSDKLEEVAQDFANKLKREKSCQPSHSHHKRLGENVFWASALQYSNGKTEVQNITAKQVVKAWGDEKSNYHYSTNSCELGKVCGHYTQIVWEDSTNIGCAKAVCSNDSQIWVCNYYPAGNYVGEKPY